MTNTREASIPFGLPVYVRSILDCLSSLGIPSAALQMRKKNAIRQPVDSPPVLAEG
jgi:hypothetical protein